VLEIIITTFKINIHKYYKLGKENSFPIIYWCKNCGYEKNASSPRILWT